MFDHRLIGLLLVFGPLSFFSFGGGQAITADIQHQSIVVHGWLTNQEFTDVFAMSRALPGPTTLISALIGMHVAGFPGALIAALAMYVPSSAMMYAATRVWHNRQDWRWRASIERGLAPVAVGLIFAAVLTVVQAAGLSWFGISIALVCAGLIFFTRVSAYVLILIVATVCIGLQFV
jgi:chromate transporter